MTRENFLEREHFSLTPNKKQFSAYLAYTKQNMVSSTKSVQIYVAKDVNIPKGALLVTDNSS